MNRQLPLLAGLLALSASMSLQAAECAAARAAKDGEKEFNGRMEAAQRQGWLLLEYLGRDGSKKSQEALAEEFGRSQVRKGQMADLAEEIKKLPADAPEIPEDGTPACEIATHVRDTVYKLVDDREAELKKYYREGYLFVLGCDLIGLNLVKLSNSANKPDSKVDPKMFKTMAAVGLETPMKAANMKPADFEKLADEMFQPSQLPARTRYSYSALRCLRINQGVEIAPLAASSEALAKCETSDWATLGKCVADATQPVKK